MKKVLCYSTVPREQRTDRMRVRIKKKIINSYKIADLWDKQSAILFYIMTTNVYNIVTLSVSFVIQTKR